MTLVHSETTSLVVNTALEIRIEDFCTSNKSKQVSKRSGKNYEYWDFRFLALAFPDGIDKDTEGFVVVLLSERSHSQSSLHFNDILQWTVSIVDIEGNLRLPRSFTKFPFGEKFVSTNFSEAKYLERSLILERADEFLPGDVLTLHCDISYTWNAGTSDDKLLDFRELTVDEKISSAETYLYDFLSSLPSVVCFRKGGNNSTDSSTIHIPTFKIFDLSFEILTLPKFHSLRKQFGVDGISPVLSYPNLETEKDPQNIKEHIWVFDTDPDRFLISLDGGKNSFGTQLIDSSDVIKRCVNIPMKEQREKRIGLTNVKTQTFTILLYYLKSGTLVFSNFQELLDVYEMSDLYEMKEIQQKCVEQMVTSFNLPTVVEQLDAISSHYSDTYLSKLLHSRCREYQNGRQIFQSTKNNRPDFACFV